MSGGVDSSVAAVLLKRQGYDVTGVFMHFWSETPKDTIPLDEFINRCCSLEAERMARCICEKIGIPFYSLNVVSEFKKAVVDYFLHEYGRGTTPNPCVVCNKEIKFKLLFKKAREFGADIVASGHYARIKHNKKNNEFSLLKAKDKTKDQSYFLYNINQKQLSHYLFPAGDYAKSDVRRMAKKFNLPTWDRPESQEICFVLDNDISRFLREYLRLKSGNIVDLSGKILGNHQGLPLFTIGQRHGLGIGGGKPYYVVKKDLKKNLLVATDDSCNLALFHKDLIAHNVNWISATKQKFPLKCEAAIRYRHKPGKAIVEKKSEKEYSVKFSKPVRAVTPGQSVVFYKGQEVLGGGIIS